MSELFKINKEDLRKAGVKLCLVLLGSLATTLEAQIPGVLDLLNLNPAVLVIVLGLNTALVDIIRKYLTDQDGYILGSNVRF